MIQSGDAQVVFEKGYYIDSNGLQTECLIQNVGWRFNPNQFRYKLHDDDKPQTHTIENVREFGIPGKSSIKGIRLRLIVLQLN